MQNGNQRQEPMHVSFEECNLLAGRVVSILHGLTRTSVKLVTDNEATLRVRCSSEHFQEMNMHIGQRVVAQIRADAVLLGAAGVWPGGYRWNRWTGRIVLVEPGAECPLITVKLQGKSCTLKCTGPVVGLTSRPEAWDAVSIVIDPEQVILMPQQSATRTRGTTTNVRTPERRVWLKARVEAVRKSASGSVVALDVGGAHISALVCGDQDALFEWTPGLPVEMHIDQWDAWLRPAGEGLDSVMCKLMYDTSL